MKEIIANEYNNVEFNKIDVFYHKISTTIDSYVTKVIFHRIIEIITMALMTYEDVLKPLPLLTNENTDELKKQFLEFFYLGEQVIIFKLNLELYNSNGPLTLDQKTIHDMNEIIDFSVAKYLERITDTTKKVGSKKSIDAIKARLNDKRFHRGSDNTHEEPGTIINWQDLCDELKHINMYIIQLVEIKRQI